ncbi:MAG TPA: type II/IV secretion system protein, partial [Armatimonadetes bacterium]|nr:type II/IV secretion system protein [Armatimonadota bacterium]
QELFRRIGTTTYPSIDLEHAHIDRTAISQLPRRFAERLQVIPIRIEGNRIIVAMPDPKRLDVIDQIQRVTGMRVDALQAPSEQIRAAIERVYGITEPSAKTGGEASTEAPLTAPADSEFVDVEEAGPALRFARGIITLGVRRAASDIHIEPREKGIVVRYRVDGVLQPPSDPLPPDMARSIVSAIKVMANMDIAETRLPQDGRIRGTFDGHQIDIRVSSLPTYWGEKLVLRLLDKSTLLMSLEQLGFHPETQSQFEQLISRPQGMILVTGPTGSGKSTTLYAALCHIRSESINIVTVEDPIEYQIDGINQTQVNYDIGLDFATQLRSILRQDPDVILVGEIRDKDTAEMAFRAALTGHLVLSTLHTNDAPSAMTRLVDMGVEPYIIGACVIGVLAQRLVRRICKHCRQQYQPSEDELLRIGLRPDQVKGMRFYRGAGCSHCHNTGYRGRIGVYELMVVTSELREAISKGANASQLRHIAVQNGMRTLHEDAIDKMQQGITTPEEVARVVYEFIE